MKVLTTWRCLREYSYCLRWMINLLASKYLSSYKTYLKGQFIFPHFYTILHVTQAITHALGNCNFLCFLSYCHELYNENLWHMIQFRFSDWERLQSPLCFLMAKFFTLTFCIPPTLLICTLQLQSLAFKSFYCFLIFVVRSLFIA